MITTAAFNNSPCCIVRSAAGDAGDGAFRFLRVGAEGAPAPLTDVGAPYPLDSGANNNPVFFKKLLDATMKLTGATNPAQLSAAEIPFLFYLVDADWNDVVIGPTLLALGFPNAKALPAPFVESVTNPFGNVSEPENFFSVNSVVFEDTLGQSAPTFADFKVFVDDTVPNITAVTIKLFHSLTT